MVKVLTGKTAITIVSHVTNESTQYISDHGFMGCDAV